MVGKERALLTLGPLALIAVALMLVLGPDPGESAPGPVPTRKILVEERLVNATMDLCLHHLPSDGTCEMNLTKLTWRCDFESKSGAAITFGLSKIGGSISPVFEDPNNVVIDFLGPYANSGGRVKMSQRKGQGLEFVSRFGAALAVGPCEGATTKRSGSIREWRVRKSERNVPDLRPR